MSAPEGALESERWLTAEEYAVVLGRTTRWVEDQCSPRINALAHSRVGRQLRFSPANRAANEQLLACGPAPEQPEPAAPTGLPTDAVELGKLLDGVRRLRPKQPA